MTSLVQCLRRRSALLRQRRQLQVVLVLLAASALAKDPSLDVTELATMDMESLMNITVVSAARKEQAVSQSAAAVYVITQEDLRRSGVTSIPEALRMVPGVQVAQEDANKWAISARGFNSRFANKLLVMIDGRTVYTPLFSGVYWDVQDLLLEDIERIEVIRGPGATLWGANAVNGVINVITKRAQDTQGTLLSGGGGTEEQGFGGARHGGPLGNNGAYRVYFKYFNRDSFESVLGGDAADDWDAFRGGFRADQTIADDDTLTLQGDLYGGTAGSTITAPSPAAPFLISSDEDTDLAGGNLLGRWTRTLSASSDLQLQLYYDRTERDSPFIRELRDTVDADFQHRLAVGTRQEWVWGAGYRLTADDIVENSNSFIVEPDRQDRQLVNVFLQDEIAILEEVRCTLGTKVEYNDYTGVEVQPSARLLWNATEKQTVWSAVSRAVRTPSRAEADFAIDRSAVPAGALGPGTPPALLRLIGNNDFDAEDLLAYELGYRVIPTDRFSVDVAAFFNVYDELRTFEQGAPFFEPDPAPSHFVVPLNVDNRMEGETYGTELVADYRFRDWWRIETAYTFLEMVLHAVPDSSDTTSEGAEGQSPQNQVSVRSLMDLSDAIELDTWFRYVDRLSNLDVDSYTTVDVRLGWRATESMEISVVGQNLIDSSHQEFGPLVLGGVPSEVERSVYAKLTIRM